MGWNDGAKNRLEALAERLQFGPAHERDSDSLARRYPDLAAQVYAGRAKVLAVVPAIGPYVEPLFIRDRSMTFGGRFTPPARWRNYAGCETNVSAMRIPSILTIPKTTVGVGGSSVQIHEMMHFVVWVNNHEARGEAQGADVLSRSLGRPVSTAIQSDRDAVLLIRREVSAYAATSLNEFVTECLSMVIEGSPSDLAREIAQPFIDYMNRPDARQLIESAIAHPRQQSHFDPVDGRIGTLYNSQGTPLPSTGGSLFLQTNRRTYRVESGQLFTNSDRRHGEIRLGPFVSAQIGQPLVSGSIGVRRIPDADRWPVKVLSNNVEQAYLAGGVETKMTEERREQLKIPYGPPDFVAAYQSEIGRSINQGVLDAGL